MFIQWLQKKGREKRTLLEVRPLLGGERAGWAEQVDGFVRIAEGGHGAHADAAVHDALEGAASHTQKETGHTAQRDGHSLRQHRPFPLHVVTSFCKFDIQR